MSRTPVWRRTPPPSDLQLHCTPGTIDSWPGNKRKVQHQPDEEKKSAWSENKHVSKCYMFTLGPRSDCAVREVVREYVCRSTRILQPLLTWTWCAIVQKNHHNFCVREDMILQYIVKTCPRGRRNLFPSKKLLLQRTTPESSESRAGGPPNKIVQGDRAWEPDDDVVHGDRPTSMDDQTRPRPNHRAKPTTYGPLPQPVMGEQIRENNAGDGDLLDTRNAYSRDRRNLNDTRTLGTAVGSHNHL